ncbi:MAG: lysophospholipase [Methylococcales bacterium]
MFDRPLNSMMQWRNNHIRVAFMIALITLGSACSPMIHKPGPSVQQPLLTDHAYLTADGVMLPVHRWKLDNDTRSVIIALHGFNDYGRFFNAAGNYLADQGIVSYAYDQRGFGGSDQPGLWAGVDAYLDDLQTFVQLVQQKHSGLPIYLLGESMGGAVVLAASSRDGFPDVAGLILSAPAVWGRALMPWYHRWLLTVSAHTVPHMHVTGSGLKITPSDNVDMLRELWKDPLVIKKTRIDAVYGVVNLMDLALQASADIAVPVCLLYGERDQVIPSHAVSTMLESIRSPELVRTALYTNGYHMLLRDLEAKTVWIDIANWIFQPDQPLPSGAEDVASALLLKDKIYFSATK